MTDLLARLKSPSVVKSSREMTPEKMEALEHMALNGSVTLSRKRGDEPTAAWEVLWGLVEAGWAREVGSYDVPTATRKWEVFITTEGRAEWTRANKRGK